MSTVYHKRSMTPPSFFNSIEQILIDPPNYPLSFYSKVSPKIAYHILNTANFSKQRRIKKLSVLNLANEIKLGKYRPVSPITFAIDENLKVVNVNGQHTLHAIIEANREVELLINFTPEDAGDIYTVIDIQAKRNPSDLLNAIGDWDEFNLTRSDINRLGSSAKILSNYTLRALETDIHAIKDTFDEYLQSYLLYKKWIIDSGANGTIKSRLLGQLPTSVACVIIKHGSIDIRKKAEDFWFKVATGEDIKSRSPEKILHDKYQRGRGESWGTVKENEVKDILVYWHEFNLRTGRQRYSPHYVSSVWQSSPNVYGTNITFKQK